MLYLDPSGRSWMNGHPSEKLSPLYIPLPFYAESMYPRDIQDPSLDYVYCTCVKCSSFIPGGFVALEVSPKRWGISLLCQECCGTPHWGRDPWKLDFPVLQVIDRLEKNMQEAYVSYRAACAVCEKFHCRDPACKEAEPLLFKHPSDALISCFYRIRLDVFSPLLDKCQKEGCLRDWRKRCRHCRLVFCSKRDMEGHVCVAIENLWG